MYTYSISSATGVVTVVGDSITRSNEGWLQVYKTGSSDAVAFFQAWTYYTVEPVTP